MIIFEKEGRDQAGRGGEKKGGRGEDGESGKQAQTSAVA